MEEHFFIPVRLGFPVIFLKSVTLSYRTGKYCEKATKFEIIYNFVLTLLSKSKQSGIFFLKMWLS